MKTAVFYTVNNYSTVKQDFLHKNRISETKALKINIKKRGIPAVFKEGIAYFACIILTGYRLPVKVKKQEYAVQGYYDSGNKPPHDVFQGFVHQHPHDALSGGKKHEGYDGCRQGKAQGHLA